MLGNAVIPVETGKLCQLEKLTGRRWRRWQLTALTRCRTMEPFIIRLGRSSRHFSLGI
jgi:hypothetical protein